MKLENEYELVETTNFEIIDLGIQEEWVYDLEIDKNHNFFGNDILVHNSVYIKSIKSDPIEAVIDGMDVADYIDTKLKELSISIAGEKLSTGIDGKNMLRIEFEKALKKVLFTSAKKRYAYRLLWADKIKFNVDSKMHVSGFDSKRSDSNNISKIAQRTVIKMILDGHTQLEVVNFLRGLNSDMKNGKYKDIDIGVPKGITKELHEYHPPTAVIKGAYYSNEKFNTNYGKNSKPRFTYIKDYKGHVPYFTFKSKTENGTFEKEYQLESIAYDTDIPEGFTIDWEKISDNTFKKKLLKIFDAMGWNWEDLTIKGLGNWM